MKAYRRISLQIVKRCKSTDVENPFWKGRLSEDDFRLSVDSVKDSQLLNVKFNESGSHIWHDEDGFQLRGEQLLRKKERVIQSALYQKKMERKALLKKFDFEPYNAVEEELARIYILEQVDKQVFLKVSSEIWNEKRGRIHKLKLKKSLEVLEGSLRGLEHGAQREKVLHQIECVKFVLESMDFLSLYEQSAVSENSRYVKVDHFNHLSSDTQGNSTAEQDGKFEGTLHHEVLTEQAKFYDVLKSVDLSEESTKLESFYKTKLQERCRELVLETQKEHFQKLIRELLVMNPKRRKLFVLAVSDQTGNFDLVQKVKICFINWRIWRDFVKRDQDRLNEYLERRRKYKHYAKTNGILLQSPYENEVEERLFPLVAEWKEKGYLNPGGINGVTNVDELVDKEYFENNPLAYDVFSKYFYDDGGWTPKRLNLPEFKSAIENVNFYDEGKVDDVLRGVSQKYHIDAQVMEQQKEELKRLLHGKTPIAHDDYDDSFLYKQQLTRPDEWSEPGVIEREIELDSYEEVRQKKELEKKGLFVRQNAFAENMKLPPDVIPHMSGPKKGEVSFRHDYFNMRWEVTVLSISRVTSQKTGGRSHSFNCHVMIGSDKGFVGVGFGIGDKGYQAKSAAIRDAYKNVRSLDIRTDGKRGIVHSKIKTKHRASLLILTPSPYEEVNAHPVLKKMSDYLGLSHCAIKLYRSRNLLNVIPNFFKAIDILKSEEYRKTARGLRINPKFEKNYGDYAEQSYNRRTFGHDQL